MNAYLKWGIGATLCGGAVAAWYLCSDSGEEVVNYRTTKVAKGDFVVKVQATGTIEPVELVDVGAQVTGKILELGRVIDPETDPKYKLCVGGVEFDIVGYPLVKEIDGAIEKPAEGLTAREVLLNDLPVEAMVDEAGRMWVGDKPVSPIMVNDKPVVNGRPGADVVDYASEVMENQLLARIDDELVKLSVERAEASVKQAEASVKQAEANVLQAETNKKKADSDLKIANDATKGGKDVDVLSPMEYAQYVSAADNAAAQLVSAQAQVQTANAQLESAKVQLKSEKRNEEYTLIVSPIKGTVIVRQVNVGQTVVSSMNASTLFLVAKDLSKMEIWASVNEADIAKIEPNQTVRYTVDALPNESFVGVVNKIRPNATMSSNVVTYIVEIDIDNSARKLTPYMSANANFIVRETSNCMLVQDSAFDYMPDEKYVAPSAKDALKNAGPMPPPAAATAPGAGKGRPEGPAKKPDFAPARLWKVNADNLLEPVMVMRGESDGTRSIVKPMPGQELAPGTAFVVGVMVKAPKAAEGKAGGDSPFGMKRPERRQRGTGGAAAKPGQNAGGGGRPGPPM